MVGRLLVIVNPGSGRAKFGELVSALERHAGLCERRVRRLADGEDVVQATREELRGGWDAVVAAGGDGTVAGVAQAAGEAGVPVLIAPMGTANMLAVQLGLPDDLDGAIALLATKTVVRRIDGMEIAGRLHLLSAGVGVSATTIRDLSDRDKRWFGLPAYLLTGVARGFTFRPTPCSVRIDGRETRLRVLDVSVLNAGFKSERPVLGIPDIRPDDGRLDVLIVWAPRPLEYLRELWRAFVHRRRARPTIGWQTAEREVRIDCRERLPVQADGDLVGEAPVTIRLVRDAVGILTPA
ncbi:MAG: NAD(+)/NADH kinase [Candidatus Eisenbacteria bacterium]|nr:NAD(+)/NADH kinase [Candidatus Eisenbacteria bacterium]